MVKVKRTDNTVLVRKSNVNKLVGFYTGTTNYLGNLVGSIY